MFFNLLTVKAQGCLALKLLHHFLLKFNDFTKIVSVLVENHALLASVDLNWMKESGKLLSHFTSTNVPKFLSLMILFTTPQHPGLMMWLPVTTVRLAVARTSSPTRQLMSVSCSPPGQFFHSCGTSKLVTKEWTF